MSSLRAPWQNGPYKIQHEKAQKHAEHQVATDTRNKLFFVFKDFSIIILSYRIGTVN